MAAAHYSMTLPGGGFNPPNRRVRTAGTDADAPFYTAPEYSCYVTTVRVPRDTDIAAWSHNAEFDTKIFGRVYYRAFDIGDGTISMVRGYRVDEPETSAASAARDNGRVAGFDNSMANIEYRPGSRARRSVGYPAPATDAIDWAAPDAPCLPPDLLD